MKQSASQRIARHAVFATLAASALLACGGADQASKPDGATTKGTILAATTTAAPATLETVPDPILTVTYPYDEYDAPHDDSHAHVDDGEQVELPDESLGTENVSEADYVLSGYPEQWDILEAGIDESAATNGEAQDNLQATNAHAQRPYALAALYVSPKGSDKNPGSAAKPFRSIARAAAAASPGTVVYVAPGTYGGSFKTKTNGTRDARIYFVSTTKWGAVIVPPEKANNKAAWDNRGNYVDIVGFQVDGSRYRSGIEWRNGIYSGGSYVRIRNNHVHHLGNSTTCTRGGGSAIGIDSYYGGEKSDVLANLVHDIGPSGCRYFQGIYVSTSGTVKNNVVTRVSEGAIHLWHDARDVVIANNSVTSSNTGIIVGGGNYYKTKGPNDNTAVYSNLVYNNAMGISEQGQTGKRNSYNNNLVFQNARYNIRLRNGLIDHATVYKAPQFLRRHDAPVPDMTPTPQSPAVGKASPVHAPALDFAGRPRNASTGYDIGACQH